MIVGASNGQTTVSDADPAGLAVEVVNSGARRPLLIICDHASNRVPSRLCDLGLSAAELGRHIAWDIGAAKVTRFLARRLEATAVLSGVSRLVIDCNRPVGHPTSICRVSDGTSVPGNQGLGARAEAEREEAYFRPYHAAIAEHLERLERHSPRAALLSVHSFTPMMEGKARPWHIGVLWNRDGRLALPLIDVLRRVEGLTVGNNEPYSGREANYTLDWHGDAHGRPHVSVEIRQDELAEADAPAYWADLLASLLPPLLEAV